MTLVNYYSPRDIFYRFLKCLVARMRPIEINIKNFADFDGMWNR